MAWESVSRPFLGEGADFDHIPVQDGVEYLRVDLAGRSALLVQGGTEPSEQGTTAVWFSADGAVLRTVNGQLIGVTERSRSWQLQSSAIGVSSEVWPRSTVAIHEVTDLQPHYRFSAAQMMERTRLERFPAQWAKELSGQPKQLDGVVWFQDLPVASAQKNGTTKSSGVTPVGLYGVDVSQKPAQVVFGFRCLDADWCISWQRWPRAKFPATSTAAAP